MTRDFAIIASPDRDETRLSVLPDENRRVKLVSNHAYHLEPLFSVPRADGRQDQMRRVFEYLISERERKPVLCAVDRILPGIESESSHRSNLRKSRTEVKLVWPAPQASRKDKSV
jgi:hypothetical protein